MNLKKSQGFTLIELMIVVVIVAILASIAVPSYISHVQEARRAEGAAFALEVQSKQESHFLKNFAYTKTLADLGLTDNQSKTGAYTVTIGDVPDNGSVFTLTLTPEGWTDDECGNLTLTNTGRRGAVLNDSALSADKVADCWK